MPVWDPTHPGPLYQGGAGREEVKPSVSQERNMAEDSFQF